VASGLSYNLPTANARAKDRPQIPREKKEKITPNLI